MSYEDKELSDAWGIKFIGCIKHNQTLGTMARCGTYLHTIKESSLTGHL